MELSHAEETNNDLQQQHISLYIFIIIISLIIILLHDC